MYSFHARMAVSLFGFQMAFGRFPYLLNGPSTITPLILATMCLVAAERLPPHHQYFVALKQEVERLLESSPGDSLFTQERPIRRPVLDDEDDIDRELGIGPEEIIAACILTTFSSEVAETHHTASLAFHWARGWTKVQSNMPALSATKADAQWASAPVQPPPTLGEVCGILPAPRYASPSDMARIWLLAYVSPT